MKKKLLQRIQDEIQKEGKISFARFMELALYDADEGYYAASPNIGFQGDYYTSPHLHPLFGTLVAKQLLEMVRRLGDQPFTLIELGGGKGLLAYDILGFFERHAEKEFNRLRYLLVERSPRLCKHQQERLLPWRGKIDWYADLPDLPEEEGVGCFVSNELFDAFPVHRLLLTADRLEEIYVATSNGNFREVLGPPSAELLRSRVKALQFRPQKPTQVEINLYAPEWVRKIARRISRGFVLTIDYGYLASDLYTERRPRGTLLCYYRHTVNEEPYQHVGEQDITTHVNFTELIRAGEEVGLKTVGFTDQTHFLLGLGIAQEMETVASQGEEPPDLNREFLALKQLVNPHGMGRVFKVLIQAKGVDGNGLTGMAFNPFFTGSIQSDRKA